MSEGKLSIIIAQTQTSQKVDLRSLCNEFSKVDSNTTSFSELRDNRQDKSMPVINVQVLGAD